MRHPDLCNRDQGLKLSRHLLHGFYLIVEKIDLTAALNFTEHRFLDQSTIPFTDEGLDRVAVWRRCCDDRDIPKARHRHIERSRNWGRCQGQKINFASKFFKVLLLRHAKSLLFIDNHQP